MSYIYRITRNELASDKDCALLCICMAVKECCRQEGIDVSCAAIWDKLYDRYAEEWMEIEESIHGDNFQDVDGMESPFKKGAFDVIKERRASEIPGRTIPYDLTFFTEREHRLHGADKNKLHYEIKNKNIFINLLSIQGLLVILHILLK